MTRASVLFSKGRNRGPRREMARRRRAPSLKRVTACFLADKRVRVAGQRRMVSSATLLRPKRAKSEIVTVSRAELDLKKPNRIRDFVEEIFVRVDIAPRYLRPIEVDLLIVDATKAEQKRGLVHETKWQSLCSEMIDADLVAVSGERHQHAE